MPPPAASLSSCQSCQRTPTRPVTALPARAWSFPAAPSVVQPSQHALQQDPPLLRLWLATGWRMLAMMPRGNNCGLREEQKEASTKRIWRTHPGCQADSSVKQVKYKRSQSLQITLVIITEGTMTIRPNTCHILNNQGWKGIREDAVQLLRLLNYSIYYDGKTKWLKLTTL